MMPQPFSVVSSQFCYPHHVDLAIARKVFPIRHAKFAVNDVNGNLVFKVIRSFFSIHGRKVILDAQDNPLINLRHEKFNAISIWEVFRGESTEEKDLIFSAKNSSTTQFDTELHVFLANNTSMEVCDYMVKGSWPERSCAVYAGDSSSTKVAQMHKKVNGKDEFMVAVNPNIDQVFIVALIVILDKINELDELDASDRPDAPDGVLSKPDNFPDGPDDDVPNAPDGPNVPDALETNHEHQGHDMNHAHHGHDMNHAHHGQHDHQTHHGQHDLHAHHVHQAHHVHHDHQVHHTHHDHQVHHAHHDHQAHHDNHMMNHHMI